MRKREDSEKRGNEKNTKLNTLLGLIYRRVLPRRAIRHLLDPVHTREAVNV